MKKALVLLAAAAALSFAGSQAQAAPAGFAGVTAPPQVILVAEGCGIGWHRGPMGGCRRNLSPAWPCWWVRGPYGRLHMVCH